MSTLLAAWIYSVGIALLLAAAAVAAEAALRGVGRAGRFAWSAAMGLSVALPAAAWLGLHAWSAPVVVFPSAVVPVALAPVTIADVAAGGPSAQTVLVALWGIASLALLARMVVGAVRLRAARAGWRAEEVSGVSVLLTDDVGPAVFGLHPASILLPTWALNMDVELRSLMLLHEREHVRAGDPWLLAAALSTVVLIPWNPLLWYQLRRLRLAIEMDCDARVLRRAPDARAYGRLLLEVGRRGASVIPALALTEPVTFLERRIRAFTRKVGPRAPRQALVLGSTAFALAALAVCARDPLSPVETMLEETVTVDESNAPVFTPYTVKPSLKNPAQVAAALQRNYPPLLRDAGIGGTTTMWFYIDENGRVQKMQVASSSGYDALDDAAMRVAGIMEFTPALNRDQPRPVWVQIPIAFRAGPAEGDAGASESPRDRIRGTPLPPPAQGSVPPSGPHFTPYTDKPALTNGAEIGGALQRNYPPLLRDAGIGGTATIWFHIGVDGRVTEVQLNHSSGHDAIDEAALRVAREMEFSPALNRGEPVAVWVMIPITFSSK